MEERFLNHLKDKKPEVLLTQAYCYPAKGCFKAEVRVTFDLKPLFPYLRSTCKTLYFDPQEKMIFLFKPHDRTYKVLLTRDQISLSLVSDLKEAREAVSSLFDFFTQVWEKREEIIPSLKPLERPSPLEVYKHLPKTNCRDCGYPSCLAFAGALTMGEAEIEGCPHLKAEDKDFLLGKLT